MASVGSTSNVQTNIPASQQTVDDKTQVGSGNIAANGPVPNAPVGDGTPQYASIIAGLSAFAPQLGDVDVEIILASVAGKLQETTSKTDTDRLVKNEEAKRISLEEKEQKLEESQKKIEEAEAKKNSIGGRIALAFQALGAALMIALGAVLAAIPGMQAVGGLMIASGVLMMIMVVDSIVKEVNDGMGIAGSIAKLAGASDEAIAKADMIFGITMAVAMVAIGIAGAVVGFVGIGAAAVSAANTAASVGSTASSTASTVATTTSAATSTASTAATVASAASTTADSATKIVTTVKTISTIADIVTAVGSGAAQGAQAGVDWDAQKSRSEAMELRADADEVSAEMQQIDDLVDQALSMLMGSSDRFAAMLDSVTDMIKDRGDTLSRMKFAG